MKPYTSFVNAVFDCIVNSFEEKSELLTRFAVRTLPTTDAEWGSKPLRLGLQDYAVLRNDDADLFNSFYCEYAGLMGVKAEDARYVVTSSEHKRTGKRTELRIPAKSRLEHSCYPKNLRRWLTGTISRKKANRCEFCILVWCHATGWNASFDKENTAAYNECHKELLTICNKYAGNAAPVLSFEQLWNASSMSYRASY